MALHVTIVTAERSILAESGVDELIVPGALGELAILPQHAALITSLDAGELRVLRGADEIAMVVTGGFMEVNDDRVTILADAAERAEDIDTARAEEARRRARERIERREAAVDLGRAEAALRRSVARLRVADRRRRRGGGTGVPRNAP